MAILEESWTKQSETTPEIFSQHHHIRAEATLVSSNEPSNTIRCNLFLRFDNFRPHVAVNLRSIDDTDRSSLVGLLSGLDLSRRLDDTEEEERLNQSENAASILITQGHIERINLLQIPEELTAIIRTEIEARLDSLRLRMITKAASAIKNEDVLFCWEIQASKAFVTIQNPQVELSRSAISMLNSISDDTTLTLVINGRKSMLQYLKKMANILMNQTPSLDKFTGGCMNLDRFDPCPKLQDKLGYRMCTSFISKREYITAMYAGAAMDHIDEARKIAAYENETKTLILIDIAGDDNGERFFGFITAPNREHCRLQPGDSMTMTFGDFADTDELTEHIPWRATVIEPIGVRRHEFLPLMVHRGRNNESGRDLTQPTTIDPEHMSRQQLQRAVFQAIGNEVKVKIVAHDSAYKTIERAIKSMMRVKEVTNPDDYSSRMLQVLLGQRPDRYPVKDLYRHIREEMDDIEKPMAPLNDGQKQVIQSSQRLTGGLQIIQGPPGTGKSFLIQQMIAPFLVAEKSCTVLVAAPTNHGADDLARDIRSYLLSLKTRSEFPHTKARYVLRLHSPSTERAIFRTQYGYIPGSQEVTSSTAPNSETSNRSNDHLQIAGSSKFQGIKDPRVQDVSYSVGFMMLCRSGVVPNSEFQDPDYGKYQGLRAIFESLKRDKEKEKFLEYKNEWEKHFDTLFAETVTGASVIVSTTHGISVDSLLNNVGLKVAAIFFDENAHEREDLLLPLFATNFALDPCVVIVGDQEQLEPQVDTAQKSRSDPIRNAFAPQLQFSFFARMIKVGMPYVMLTEQHRMVDDISSLANTLTYRGKLTNALSTSIENRPIAARFRAFAQRRTGQPCNRMLVHVPSSATNKTEVNEKGSKGNHYLVCVVGELLRDIAAEFNDSDLTIAILTPYLHQRSHYSEMKKQLAKLNHPLAGTIMLDASHEIEKLTIGTFDGSQGRQFDIVIIDLPVDRYIGFLADERRMNVAVTRARNGLILVCDRETIESARGEAPYLRSLLRQFRGKTWTRPQSDSYPRTTYYTPPSD